MASSDERYAVSSGVYCFFQMKGATEGTNHFAGFKITDIDKSPNVSTVKQVRHQLSQGGWAKYIKSGEKTPGELTIKGFFEFETGVPEGPQPEGFTSSITDGVDGVIMLAVVQPTDVTKADVFFKSDAIFTSDGGFSGPIGELITSEVKFQLSGKPLMGTANISAIVDTGLGASGEIAKNDAAGKKAGKSTGATGGQAEAVA